MFCRDKKCDNKAEHAVDVCIRHNMPQEGKCIITSCKKYMNKKQNYTYDSTFCKHHSDKFRATPMDYARFIVFMNKESI